MPGLVPGIHVLIARKQDVDGRDKPGHDEFDSYRRSLKNSRSSVAEACSPSPG
jgi:hypothetical protein